MPRRKDQPTPQQTATPNPGPFGAQFVNDLLNRQCVEHKLKMAQRCEDREPTVLASKELLGTTILEESSITNASSLLQPTPREDREPNVLPSKELLDATTLESITNTSSPMQSTQSGSGHAYLMLQEPGMLSSEELLIVKATLGKSSIMDSSSTRAEVVTQTPPSEELIVKATLGKSSIMDSSSTRAEVVTQTPPISARKPACWNHQFFIRVDFAGVLHTYPKLGGPFRSMEEAENAILCRLDELRDPKMCTNDGLSSSEIAIRDALHWPDGTKKYSSNSNADKDHIGLLIQALLEKYNEEKKLLGDDAYHVEDIVSFQEIYERNGGWYYHLNCTRKTKGGVDNLFFAEVLIISIRGQHDEFELTCLHMVKPAVDNGLCHSCKRNNVGMKHPIDAGKYKGGHDSSRSRRRVNFPMGPLDLPKGVDARMKDMEERIRCLFQDPDIVESDAGRTGDDDATMNKDRDVIKSDA